jgi:hypothetical protein
MARIVDLSNLTPFQAVNLLSDPGAVAGPKLVPNAAIIGLAWNMEDGKIAHNVLYGRYQGSFAGTPAQATAIMTALTTGGTWTALAAFLATSTTFAQVYIRDMNTPDNPIIYGTATPAAGTSVSAALPNEVAACVTLTTAKAGPQNRGRFYVPGFATNALATGNVIAPAVLTALNNWSAVIATAFTAQGYTHVIGQPHRAGYTSIHTGRVFPERLATSINVTGRSVRDNHWDTQRRRGLK